jgi:hypothetical protein
VKVRLHRFPLPHRPQGEPRFPLTDLGRMLVMLGELILVVGPVLFLAGKLNLLIGMINGKRENVPLLNDSFTFAQSVLA